MAEKASERVGVNPLPSRYLLDTNTIIYALQRSVKLPDGLYMLSVITEMELLSYSRLTEEDEREIRLLLKEFTVLPVDGNVKEEVITLRRRSRLKLPDAIIAATAIVHDAILVSSDKDLHGIPSLQTIDLEALSRT
jgi:predicted nucleic acid-binding protein